MACRYLFGPVNAHFADQYLNEPRHRGDCLAFDCRDGADLTIAPDASWDDVCVQLPGSWRPDFVALYFPYRDIPLGLWSTPVPIVGLAGDWNLLWHYYRRCLPLCDRVLTDTLGVSALGRIGITHARVANIYGCRRCFFESPLDATERDIDILFIGNCHQAIQRERTPWLARLTQLAPRWRVMVTTCVFGEDYRRLLGRARIVFNRGIRGECNSRAIEATAAGALLFQEADNVEIGTFFQPASEFIAYDSDNLESLLEHYLVHEDERRAVAEAGRRRAQRYGFSTLWDSAVASLDLESATPQRRVFESMASDDRLLMRTWQMLHQPSGADPALAGAIEQELNLHPRSATLHHALAVVLGHSTAANGGKDGRRVVDHLRQALHYDPAHLMAELNLAEVLMYGGQEPSAVEVARHALASLEGRPELSSAVLDSPHLPPEFDCFRVEWERAAWSNAGQPGKEKEAKRSLLRWRLHTILAGMTGDLAHHYEAAAARPDLPSGQAALGCALARAGNFTAARSHLQRAVADNPFDVPAAAALFGVYGETASWPAQHRLAQDYGLLHQSAPAIIERGAWFAPPRLGGLPATDRRGSDGEASCRVVWEGGFEELHSLALVNRELCWRLIERGCQVALRSTNGPRPVGPILSMPDVLTDALHRSDRQPADVHVRHQWPPCWTAPPAGHWVLIQPWEFGALPKTWIEHLQTKVDEVWVPTSWVRTCFIRSGVAADRVHVVPNGVDVPLLRQQHQRFPFSTNKRFKFLFVGGTIQRKGIDILLRAYSETFAATDDVCLVIKDVGGSSFYFGQTADKQITALQSQSAPEIEYITRDLSAGEMASLYQSCDCLVHPYRGEGFGLPIAEAMACGLPVIVTGYGACLDFCDESTAYLLPARLHRFKAKRLESAETVDYPWLAEPDLAMLRFYLRYVVENPEEARDKGERAAAHICKNFSWDRAADSVIARLAQLRNEPIRRLQPPENVVGTQHASVASPLTSPLLRPGSSAKPSVSLCMIVKNEEKHLADCLASVVDLVQEIIVVDTGSSDRTKEIARQAGAHVFDFDWVDSFAAAQRMLASRQQPMDFLARCRRAARRRQPPKAAAALCQPARGKPCLCHAAILQAGSRHARRGSSRPGPPLSQPPRHPLAVPCPRTDPGSGAPLGRRCAHHRCCDRPCWLQRSRRPGPEG